ncbi:MAG: spore coat associated protein CotJA [Clostridia bacterium]|nr:spore coat associated protein CotJA [Clostridia bacterium]
MDKNTDGYFYNGISALPKDTAVTMAYIPFQTDATEYDVASALKKGTLFVVLDKPFTGVNTK